MTRKGNIDVINIAAEDWFLSVTRNMSYWHEWLMARGYYHNTRDFGAEASLRQVSLTVAGTRTSLFFTYPNYEEYVSEISKLFKDEASVQSLKEKYIRFGKELRASLAACDASLSIAALENFFKDYQRYTTGLMLTASFGRSATEKLTALLRTRGIPGAAVDETVAIITYPDEHTPLYNSQLGLLEIGARFQKEKKREQLEEDLVQWVLEYGNIPVNFCEAPWTIEEAHKQLQELLSKNCEEELVLAKKNHGDKIFQKKEVLAKINDVEIAACAYALAECTYLNEYRKNIISKVSLGYRGVFAKIAALTGSNNWQDCFYLTPEEMLVIVGGEKLPIVSLIEKRQKAGLITSHEGIVSELDSEDCNSLFEFVEQIYGQQMDVGPDHEKELKGFSANRGVIRGRVKVILSSRDFSKFETGDVLVATMTSVDFVPLMERAVAFVTNEGGITSHAAIVAREMNKPCIVGTKIATQVLKDGDIVEVDAEKGIVRILKRA